MLSKFFIAFIPWSKEASFNFIIAVIVCSDFGAKKIRSVTVSIFFFI